MESGAAQMNDILINLLPAGMFSSYPDIVPINIGASGAKVYSLNNKYILKYSERDKTDNDIWNSCIREYEFFSSYNNLSYIPEIRYMHKEENKIIIIMKKYNTLSHSDFNDDLMEEIIGLLTDINTTPYKGTKKPDDSKETDKEKIAFCARG
jgi:Mg2+/Co2+ transporter CorB